MDSQPINLDSSINISSDEITVDSFSKLLKISNLEKLPSIYNLELVTQESSKVVIQEEFEVVTKPDIDREKFKAFVELACRQVDLDITSYLKQGKRLVIACPTLGQFQSRISRLEEYIPKSLLPFMSVWIGPNAFDRYKISGWNAENLVVLILRPSSTDTRMTDTINYLKSKAEKVIYDISLSPAEEREINEVKVPVN